MHGILNVFMQVTTTFQKIATKINEALSFDLVISLIVVGIVLYFRSLFNGFVGDDGVQIVQNEAIKHVDSLLAIFGKGTFATGGAAGGLEGVYYKPLMTICYAIVYGIFGLAPFAYHACSLIIHITNVILLFFVSRTIFRLAKWGYAQVAALLVALIFLVHPANSEAVLYIANLQDLLVVTFLLIALCIALSIVQRQSLSWKKYLLLAGVLFLGMLSKESSIVGLILIPIFFFLFAKQFFKKNLMLSGGVFLVYLFFRYQIAHIPLFQKLGFIPIHAATFPQRLMTIPYELFSYLRLMFYPQQLFLYQHDVILSITDPKFYLTLPIIALVVYILIWFAFRLKSTIYTFALLWVLVGFGIISNIIPLDMTIAERWLYLPFIGMLWAIFLIVYYLNHIYKHIMMVALAVVVALLPFYVVRSFVRSGDFQSNYTLYSHDIRFNPRSYELLTNYGVSLIEVGKYQEATIALQQSIQRSPQYWPAYSDLGLAYEKLGNIQEAKQYYMLSIGLSHYFVPYENLAALTLRTEKPENALIIIQQALPLYPNNPQILTLAAKAYKKMGMIQQAQVYAQKAYLLDTSLISDPDIQSLLPTQ